ncbi:carotenoid biosynthesis protein [Roseivirga sp.]|uniref:carotenoid biosynthesis protein n=1 Tax=Roseivirga sp. TaxID=1964215 RepID=UPI003B52E4E8
MLMLPQIDRLPFVNQKNAFYLILAMHLAGAIGLSFPQTRELFQMLTPLNLLATAAIVLHFEKEKSVRYILFIMTVFLMGFFVEVAGVKTGAIFGYYTYGPTLGPKFLDVPLAIGINWVILIYSTNLLARNVTKSKYYPILLGAVLMTAIDIIIEPVAVKFDFWTWESSYIPIRNYVGWFVASLIMHSFFTFFMPKANNPLAIRLLYILIGFFIALNFI